MSNGKGSTRRPLVVPQNEFDKNWDDVFKKLKYRCSNCKKDLETTKPTECPDCSWVYFEEEVR